MRWPLLCSDRLRRSSLRGEETADPSPPLRFSRDDKGEGGCQRRAVGKGKGIVRAATFLWQPPSPLATTLSFGNHPLLWQPPSPLATTLSFGNHPLLQAALPFLSSRPERTR